MTAPTYPALQRGTALQLFMGDGATPTEHFTLVAIAKTVDFDRKIEFDDSMEIDVNNPLNLPVRVSVAKGETIDLTISGKCDYVRFHAIEANFDGNPHNWQLEMMGTGANGGGIYQGAAMLSDLKVQKSDNGMVAWSGSLKGQGLWPFTANS